MEADLVHDIIRAYSLRSCTRTTIKSVDERPVCTHYERCEGCPYPTHGFICWSQDGECIRTRMEHFQRRKDLKKSNLKGPFS